MFYKHRLYKIELFISTLHLVWKVLIFLVPLVMILWLLLYKKVFHENNNAIQLLQINTKIQTIKHLQQQTPSMMNLIEKLEVFAKQNSITFKALKQEHKTLSMEFQIKREHLLDFIQYCEYFSSHSSIKKLILKYQDTMYEGEMKLSFDNYFKKPKWKKSFVHDLRQVTFKLNAIIGQYVVINEQLLKLHERIEGYRIEHIQNNTVILKKTNEQIVLKVHHAIK